MIFDLDLLIMICAHLSQIALKLYLHLASLELVLQLDDLDVTWGPLFVMKDLFLLLALLLFCLYDYKLNLMSLKRYLYDKVENPWHLWFYYYVFEGKCNLWLIGNAIIANGISCRGTPGATWNGLWNCNFTKFTSFARVPKVQPTKIYYLVSLDIIKVTRKKSCAIWQKTVRHSKKRGFTLWSPIWAKIQSFGFEKSELAEIRSNRSRKLANYQRYHLTLMTLQILSA